MNKIISTHAENPQQTAIEKQTPQQCQAITTSTEMKLSTDGASTQPSTLC